METPKKNVFLDLIMQHPGWDAAFVLIAGIIGGVLAVRSAKKSMNTMFGSQAPAEFMRESR